MGRKRGREGGGTCLGSYNEEGGRECAREGVEVRGSQGFLVEDAGGGSRSGGGVQRERGGHGGPALVLLLGDGGGWVNGGWGEGDFSSSAKPREAGGRFCNTG